MCYQNAIQPRFCRVVAPHSSIPTHLILYALQSWAEDSWRSVPRGRVIDGQQLDVGRRQRRRVRSTPGPARPDGPIDRVGCFVARDAL